MKSNKLASAIAIASTIGAAGAANAVCPTGTTDVTASYGAALAATGRTLACEFAGATNTAVTMDDTANNLYVLNGAGNGGKIEVGTSYDAVDASGNFAVNTAAENAATLTIEAGAIVIGDDSNDAANEPDRLIINRGSQLLANGTLEAPILFTGLQNAVDSADEQRAQWGGLYLNGYGFNNGCDDAILPAAPTACQRSGEADTGFHGGTDNADDSGSITYTVIAHAGDAFSPTVDLNGAAFQSVGSGTTVSHLQVHNNVDDGVEFYGGAVFPTNLVLTNNGDDSLDSTEGWQGGAQFVVITQDGASDQFDRAFESDNNKSPNDASLQTNATVANVTIVRNLDTVAGGGAEPDLVKIRRGSALNISNLVIDSPIDQGACFDITDGDGNGSHASALGSNLTPNANAEGSDLDQVFHNCFERDDSATTTTYLDTDNAGEVNAYTSTLSGYVNGANESAAAAATLPAGFSAVSFVGAVESCDNDWTAGWTIAGSLPTASDCETAVPVMGWAGLAALFAGIAGIATRVRRVK